MELSSQEPREASIQRIRRQNQQRLDRLFHQGLTTHEALDALSVLARQRFTRVIFADDAAFPRELYPKHIDFLNAGAFYKERLFCAANRVGKTVTGAFEATCHATGLYPQWWRGRRFGGPTEGWACGTTGQTTRDIVQRELLGPSNAIGTGMIPAECILDVKRRSHGLADSFEQIVVRHASGGMSVIGLKSYEQGRKSFEGTAKHWIWCDEEPPQDCYTEMLTRTVTTRGIIWLTFTPLQGMSEVVKSFIEPEERSKKVKWFIQAGWKDAPHIPEEEQAVLLASYPVHELRARTEGEPALGSGAIYPIAEDKIVCHQFVPSETWPRSFGIDVGWNWTVAVWGARDVGNDTTYLYGEYVGSQEPPAVHAAAILARGKWIPGTIDPASAGSNQVDGQKLLDIYRNLGLILHPAVNAVGSGIQTVWDLLVTQKLKVMPNCENWLREYRKYHRDEKGKIVKHNDHLMDATRYRMVSGRSIERTNIPKIQARPIGGYGGGGDRSWMG